MELTGKKIYVGLSGGVDSATTAALLQRAGANVTGVFIKGWYPPGMPCTWAADRRDAMRVAARLRIPFITLDASAEYKKGVIDYLLSEYRAGRTPNPDIMCNREVKFGAFYAYARTHGADFIATGHYARSEEGELLRGVDPGKDQSYFLWAISKDALAHTLFPLGNRHKHEVRALARQFNLPNAEKRDSQGICFLGNISVEDFLTSEFGSEPGVAVNEAGEEVGTHTGVLVHTIGERVPLQNAAPGPWYVVRKDVVANRLIVSLTTKAIERTTEIRLRDQNWFSEPCDGEELIAQYRYHGPKIPGTCSNDGTIFIPSTPLNEPIAEGQSLVLYRDDRCIGGGIIA